jgi:hypothetical protein
MLNSNGFLVICDGSFSSRINRFLVVADQSIYYPEGVLEEAIIHVGQSYVPMDFVIVETGGGERASIILGRPFLCTTKAIIYEEHATIIFSIKDKKEKFSFKERILHSPAHPQMLHLLEEPTTPAPKKKNNKTRGGTSSAKC